MVCTMMASAARWIMVSAFLATAVAQAHGSCRVVAHKTLAEKTDDQGRRLFLMALVVADISDDNDRATPSMAILLFTTRTRTMMMMMMTAHVNGTSQPGPRPRGSIRYSATYSAGRIDPAQGCRARTSEAPRARPTTRHRRGAPSQAVGLASPPFARRPRPSRSCSAAAFLRAHSRRRGVVAFGTVGATTPPTGTTMPARIAWWTLFLAEPSAIDQCIFHFLVNTT